MKKNELERIDYDKQYDCLVTAKRYLEIMPALSLETILGIALLDNEVAKKPLHELGEYYSYYNRENAEQFNINPSVMMFDDRWHASLFLNFLVECAEVINRLQTTSAKIDIIPNETKCDFIDNQFISRDKCKICVNHVWSNYKIVYCLKDYKPKESKDE